MQSTFFLDIPQNLSTARENWIWIRLQLTAGA
jgi:hypothetical protein